MQHLDEARQKALTVLETWLGSQPEDSRAVLIDDLFGLLRVVLWTSVSGEGVQDRLNADLQAEAGRFWSGEIWLANGASEADRSVYEEAWDQAREGPQPRLRVLDRHRNRGSWFLPLQEPAWEVDEPSPATPAVLVFYSFKGGVGRSTALVAFAISRARLGERVVVIDADLDAPGVGRLLAADAQGSAAHWGVLDYLLERPLGEVDLSDYHHACRRERVTGSGEIRVFPASRVDGDYLGKLARVDLEPRAHDDQDHPLAMLVDDVKSELRPHWILFDTRAGLADPAGWLLGGIGHLHVLFGTSSEQSWAGLSLVLERLGADQLKQGRPQADCLLVQAMVPPGQEVSQAARAHFAERAREEFSLHYYAEDPVGELAGEGDDVWYVGDAESGDAPDVPVPVHYNERLAYFRDLEDIADLLAEDADYRALAERITGRFRGEAE